MAVVGRHQHARGLFGKQQHAIVGGTADQPVEFGVEVGELGGVVLGALGHVGPQRR
jgi:hypothetical protein